MWFLEIMNIIGKELNFVMLVWSGRGTRGEGCGAVGNLELMFGAGQSPA